MKQKTILSRLEPIGSKRIQPGTESFQKIVWHFIESQVPNDFLDWIEAFNFDNIEGLSATETQTLFVTFHKEHVSLATISFSIRGGEIFFLCKMDGGF